jgi:hypothetical protein
VRGLAAMAPWGSSTLSTGLDDVSPDARLPLVGLATDRYAFNVLSGQSVVGATIA